MINIKYTDLDNIAYKLYCYENINRILLTSKKFFVNDKGFYDIYYKQAKTKLRQKKLKKINEKR